MADMKNETYTQLMLRPWGVTVSGGADDPPHPPAPPETPPPADPPAPPADPEGLGDAGKRALTAERAARAAAERDAKAVRDELEALKAERMTESERALADARKEGRDEAMAVANKRLVAAEVKSAATGKLVDPSIADRLLDVSTFTVDESGNVDSKAITSAIDALLAEKPYLAATAGRTPAMGSGDGGPQGNPPAGQLGKADLDKLLREGKHDEITKARNEGRFSDLMGA